MTPREQGTQGVTDTVMLHIDIPDDQGHEGIFIQMPDGRVLMDERRTMNDTPGGSSQ